MTAEDRFKATADTLQAKQNAISGFLNRARQVETVTGGRGRAPRPAAAPLATMAQVHGGAPAEGLDVEAPADLSGGGDGTSQLTVMPGPAQPQPRIARPVKSSFLGGAWKKLADLFEIAAAPLHAAQNAPVRDIPAAYAQHPALRALAEQTARVAGIGRDENVLMARTEGALDQGVGKPAQPDAPHRHQSRPVRSQAGGQ